MSNIQNNTYKYLVLNEKKIFNFEDRSSTFLFTEYNNVDVFYLDIIDAFQHKYTIDEIKSNKVIMDDLFNQLILPVKEILVYFSNNEVDINISNDVFITYFYNDFLGKIEDLNKYCGTIATKLNNQFNFLFDSKTSSMEANSLYLKLIFFFDEELNLFATRATSQSDYIHFSHVGYAISFFLCYFNRLLKCQSIFNTFFDLLLTKKKNDLLSLFFSKFFLMYECNFLFDIILHISEDKIRKSSHLFNDQTWINNIAYTCLDLSKDKILSLFLDSNGHFVRDLEVVFDCLLYTQLENQLMDTLVNKTYNFSSLIETTYLDSVFTIWNKQLNRYENLCHDAFPNIIDFKYVLSMISALSNGSYMHQQFLDESIKKINESCK